MDAIYIYKTHTNIDINYSDGIILDILGIEYDSILKTIVNRRLEGDIITINENDIVNDDDRNDIQINNLDNDDTQIDIEDDMDDNIEDDIDDNIDDDIDDMDEYFGY
jgi:hypothetical protein